ncbi:SCP2 sterol-binding domain-containing protein [Thiohalobacter sp. IOR34]|uniref:ubiquinone anaerobic biosynthesis accessory factor UbiT n=1 Tax=Thiohalobacter sp. IOR34 TaxID=3057176 RepID=UPI0025B14669|nr:SCP2 sterol-binding domain-containing protein [Thiohalobacter sp. IOR34]WJW74995.1 SCP2 sterol-binding domain-containing protein [Thiohalobacter sp. IOR34]
MNSASLPSRQRTPSLPPLLTWPLEFLPRRLPEEVFVAALNRLFAEPLRNGELDFLEGRMLQIGLTDLGRSLRIGLRQRRLQRGTPGQRPDIRIEGKLYEFLLLATRREDADTLFFNRRLRLAGDTELGLYVKNFLDAQEPDERLQPLLRLLEQACRMLERWG